MNLLSFLTTINKDFPINFNLGKYRTVSFNFYIRGADLTPPPPGSEAEYILRLLPEFQTNALLLECNIRIQKDDFSAEPASGEIMRIYFNGSDKVRLPYDICESMDGTGSWSWVYGYIEPNTQPTISFFYRGAALLGIYCSLTFLEWL